MNYRVCKLPALSILSLRFDFRSDYLQPKPQIPCKAQRKDVKPNSVDPAGVARIAEYLQSNQQYCDLLDLKIALQREASQIWKHRDRLKQQQQQLSEEQPESSSPSMLEQLRQEEAQLNNEQVDVKAVVKKARERQQGVTIVSETGPRVSGGRGSRV